MQKENKGGSGGGADGRRAELADIKYILKRWSNLPTTENNELSPVPFLHGTLVTLTIIFSISFCHFAEH